MGIRSGAVVLATMAIALLVGCTGNQGDDAGSKAKPEQVIQDPSNAAGLISTAWRLADLGGRALPAEVECTLEFPDAGRVVGKAACNRFFGTATIAGASMQLSQIGSTRMACPDELMTYERDYLVALQAAQRFTLDGDVLLVHTSASATPLRFARSDP